MDSIFRSFSFGELLSFGAVNSIYRLNDFVSGYVCCSWMCLDAGESFFQTSRPLLLAIRSVKGLGSFLLEMLSVKFGKQECGSLRDVTLNPR